MAAEKQGAGRPRRAAVLGKDPIPARVLHKREFLARVAEELDLSRAQIRDIVEATLNQLGRAIGEGETLSLPPFGKARVTRQATAKGDEVLVLRLRRKDVADETD